MSHVTFGRGVLLRSACSPVFPFGNVSRHLAEFGSHCSGLAAAASEPVTTSSGADLIQDLRFLEVAVSRVCLHSAVNVEGSLEPSKRSVYVDFKKAVRVARLEELQIQRLSAEDRRSAPWLDAAPGGDAEGAKSELMEEHASGRQLQRALTALSV